MKKLLLLPLITLIPILTMAQGKKELEEQLADLNSTVSALQTENGKLQSDVDTFRSKYEDVLKDRIEQEKEVGELNDEIDSLSASEILSSGNNTGTIKLIEFTNETAKFTVPAGKNWQVYSIFSDYVTGGTEKYNTYREEIELEQTKDIRIFLKDLNGIEKTNYIKNIYGTQLFRSTNASTVIPYPIIFPEKTTFNLIILKGNLGALQLYDGKAYISLVETDN